MLGQFEFQDSSAYAPFHNKAMEAVVQLNSLQPAINQDLNDLLKRLDQSDPPIFAVSFLY